MKNNSTDQFDLFLPEAKKLARREHPLTSKIAAERSFEFMSDHRKKVYETLLDMEDGTPYEIASAAGMEVAQVFRRLNELEKSGHIYRTGKLRTGPHDRLCTVWKAYR